MSSRVGKDTLRRRVLHAGTWAAGGYGLSQVLRLVSNLIMTRLLVPEMFGVMAIATMVLVILTLLSDIGLRQSVVRSNRGDDPIFLDTAWLLQIIRGFVLWLLALALSIAIYIAQGANLLPESSVYASAVLPWVIAVSSLSAIILGFHSTKAATAHRSFDQKRLIQIELIGQAAALVFMVPIGFLTHSIWALVTGGLVSSLIRTALSHAWMTGHQNRFRWEKESLQELLGFGKWIAISSGIFVFVTNGDRLLLGGFLDANQLGLYAIAALLVGTIEGGLSRLFMRVSLPALSEIARKSPSRLREVYYRLRVPGDLLLLFLAGFLYTGGQVVIDVLYDVRYSDAGEMLQILALSLFAARYLVAQQVYIAVGIPKYQTIINAVRFVSLYALVPTLYYAGGDKAAIWGISLHAIATLPFVFRFNALLRLNDFRKEAFVLIALPTGVLGGLALRFLAA